MFGAVKPGFRSLATLKLVMKWMLSANFKPKRTAVASRGFLATVRFSCYYYYYYESSLRLKLRSASNVYIPIPRVQRRFAFHARTVWQLLCVTIAYRSASLQGNWKAAFCVVSVMYTIRRFFGNVCRWLDLLTYLSLLVSVCWIVRPSVRPSACEQQYWESCGWISIKLFEHSKKKIVIKIKKNNPLDIE